jgi:hypothetical protein
MRQGKDGLAANAVVFLAARLKNEKQPAADGNHAKYDIDAARTVD